MAAFPISKLCNPRNVSTVRRPCRNPTHSALFFMPPNVVIPSAACKRLAEGLHPDGIEEGLAVEHGGSLETEGAPQWTPLPKDGGGED
jgi:hypothetical protein